MTTSRRTLDTGLALAAAVVALLTLLPTGRGSGLCLPAFEVSGFPAGALERAGRGMESMWPL